MPFLLEERKNRVAMLEQMMTARRRRRISEKYRRIVEAYQIEMDYGRTHRGLRGRSSATGDDARTVQFLRVGRGRPALPDLDGKETGYWDARGRTGWSTNDYRHGFKEGVAVAKKLRAPEMLIVPVSAPKEAKS